MGNIQAVSETILLGSRRDHQLNLWRVQEQVLINGYMRNCVQ